MNPKQIKCIELLLEGDMTQKEIAKAIKVSENTICNWKKDDDFRAEYETALRGNIQMAAGEAYKTQVKLLKSRSEMVRHYAAKDILDRAGLKPTDKVDLNGAMGLKVVVDYGDDSD